MPSCEGNKIELTRLLRPPALPSFALLMLAFTYIWQRQAWPNFDDQIRVSRRLTKSERLSSAAGRAPFLPPAVSHEGPSRCFMHVQVPLPPRFTRLFPLTCSTK